MAAYGRNFQEFPSDADLIEELMGRIADEDRQRKATGQAWYRCYRAEQSRDCPIGHRWSDDGERAYHHRS